MNTAEDHGLADEANPRCKHCTNPDGSYKRYDEVFEGTVRAMMAGFIPHFGKLSREEAEQKAQYLKSLPAWKE